MNDPDTTLSGIAEEHYSDLWAKLLKPLQQIYGHIDRISNKEAGSLLIVMPIGWASLDREMMRKAAVDEKAQIRDALSVLRKTSQRPLQTN